MKRDIKKVIHQHGTHSPVVAAIRAAIMALLVSSALGVFAAYDANGDGDFDVFDLTTITAYTVMETPT